ncbi:MAG: DUF4292 domain-containing protein [Paludibacter sp.]|nr:DUF4292 domain-containing protein [Paludibacter sp.]
MKKTRMKIKKLLFLSAIFLAIVACKSKQQVEVKTLPKSPIAELIQKVQKAEPVIQTANVSKMNMSIDLNGRDASFNAACRMVKDSVIQLSVIPFLGYEAFRMDIGTDSIKIYDKMNRKLYAADYNFIASRLGVLVSFYDLQSLLTDHFFCLGLKEPDSEACKTKNISDQKRNITFEKENIIQNSTVNGNYRIEAVEFGSKTNKYKMKVLYKDIAMFDSIAFPQQISLSTDNDTQYLNCDFNISKANFNKPVKFTKLDESRFTREDIQKILKK